MDEIQARAIGERLARAAGATSENEWAIWGALMAFPSSGVDDVWLLKDQATAHWLDGQALVSATTEDQASLCISARPTVLGDWRVDVKFESAQLNDAGFSRPGLASHWVLRLPGGESFEIHGEVLVARDSSRPDDAEQLARRIAMRMLES